MSAATRARRPGPVGPGYMPKGGAAAARQSNAEWADGRAREARSDPAGLTGWACWAVVAASAGALFTEGAILWVLFA